MKKVWITSLVKDEDKTPALMQVIQQYGLEPQGHFWSDDLSNLAYIAPLDNLIDPNCGVWIILTDNKSLKKESVQFGLALLSLAVFAKKGSNFPIIFASIDDLDAGNIPEIMGSADVVDYQSPSLGVKAVAKVNIPLKKVTLDYRLDIHAATGAGLWFEVGPESGEWNGILFGTNGGRVNFQGVGPKGALPEKCTNEHPTKGMKIMVGTDEYTAWGIQNKIDSSMSYYVRVNDVVNSILFGEMPEDDAPDLHILKLI